MNAPTKPPTPTPTPTVAPTTPSATPATKLSDPPPFQMGTTYGLSPYLKMLVYGRPGVGKTELLGTAADVPTMQDVLFVDVEKGEMTIHDNSRIKNWESLINNRIPVVSFKEVSRIHDWLVGHCRVRDAFLKGDQSAKQALINNEARIRGISPNDIQTPKLFRTLILDSLSEVNQYSNYELLGVDEAKVLSGNADEIEVATWDEFRKNNQRIQMLVKAFRNLPMHILVSAHEQYKQDELKKFHYEPAVTGQLARQVQGAFDIVGYFIAAKQGDKLERRLYVQPVANFDAKNRRSVFKGEYFNEGQLTLGAILRETGLMKQTGGQ